MATAGKRTADDRSAVPGARRATPAPTGRLDGLDAARGLAIAGMMVCHYVPFVDPRWRPGALLTDPGLGRELLFGLPAGRASALFVVLAGAGLGLLLAGGGPGAEVLRRAAVLGCLGLLLVGAFPGMILHVYALWLAAALLLRSLDARTLLLVAAVLVPAGWYGAERLGGQSDWLRPWDAADPAARAGEFWPDLLFTHAGYPAVQWLALVLFGLWLARLPLRERRWQLGLLLGGTAAAVGLPLLARLAPPQDGLSREPLASLLSASPHSLGAPALLGAAGAAAAAIGACLLLAGPARRLLRPLAAAGRLSLTLYLLHLVPFWLWFEDRFERYGGHPDAEAVLTPLAIFAGFAAASLLWLRHFRHGPLEAALRLASRGGGLPRRARGRLDPAGATPP